MANIVLRRNVSLLFDELGISGKIVSLQSELHHLKIFLDGFLFLQTIRQIKKIVVMKKRMHQLILTSMLFFIAFNSHAANTNRNDDETMKAKIAAMTEQQKEARYEEIKARVEEIKNMDKSTLTKAERKDLKTELRGMQKEAKALGRGGIYISLAGIIIIILVLILIL